MGGGGEGLQGGDSFGRVAGELGDLQGHGVSFGIQPQQVEGVVVVAEVAAVISQLKFVS